MQFISPNTKIPFMKYRWVVLTFSAILTAWSIYIFVSSGTEKYGVDFTGGVEAVVSFNNPANIGDVRKKLKEGGIAEAVVQDLHGAKNQFAIRFKADKREDYGSIVTTKLGEIANNNVKIDKLDHVGPVIGDQIRTDALWAVLWAIVGITTYLTIRFEFKFALGAAASLAHDVIVATGITIYAGHQISAGVLAALLTILGYSVNDTIIVFDRIRERMIDTLKQKSGEYSLSEIIDRSINETLSRTIMTSLTVIFVCFALWMFGGGAVEDLAFVLLVGVSFGTYSSVYVASPVVLELDRFCSGKFSRKK